MDGWKPFRLEGEKYVNNYIQVQSLDEVWQKLEEFREGVTKDSKDWDLMLACSIMGVDPSWFVDERSLELVELYLFNRQNPAIAFPVGFGEQPAIWIEAKLILDSIWQTSIQH